LFDYVIVNDQLEKVRERERERARARELCMHW
jgi:hypothetical protein